MCYNCGCQNPQDDMGDANNITESTLQHLADHQDKSLADTKLWLLQLLERNDRALNEEEHLKEMFANAGKAWGQSPEDVKRNTLDLLRKQLKKS